VATNVEVLAQTISAFNAGLLTDEIVARARCQVLDALTTVGASLGLPGGDIPIAISPLVGGTGPSTVLFSDIHTSPAAAAFANTQRSVAVDLGSNLLYSQGLPGLSILPVLALGEELDVPGRELITAIVCGFEVAGRVALSMPPTYRVSPDGRHIETLESLRTRWVSFGGAASVAKLLKLSVEQTANALALVGGAASYPRARHNSAMAKYGVMGYMGWSSVVSGLMAQRGFTGDLRILEEDGGFYDAIAAEYRDEHPFGAPLGATWLMSRSNFKRYPTGTHNQQGLHALATLMARNDISPEEISRIRFGRAIGVATAFADVKPDNYIAAQFSMPFAAAMIGLNVAPTEWAAHLNDPMARELAGKVVLEKDDAAVEEFIEDFGAHARDAWRPRTHVTVTTRTSEYSAWSEYGEVMLDELEQKCRTHLAGRWSDSSLATMIDQVRTLELLASVRSLTAACSGEFENVRAMHD
jgi:2-methylcitrate dehydratase PrpD